MKVTGKTLLLAPPALLLLFVFALALAEASDRDAPGPMQGNSMMGNNAQVPRFPPVFAYAEGEGIYFIHSEASDPKVVKMLTEMMGGSPVLYVPALSKVPRNLTARVFVFTNGITPLGPRGPFGFQPDVFEAPPPSKEYSPLRRIVKVSWRKGTTPRLLTSAREVLEAVDEGELVLEETGIVVNMPLLTWPGGSR